MGTQVCLKEETQKNFRKQMLITLTNFGERMTTRYTGDLSGFVRIPDSQAINAEKYCC
jgi:hypothetical protein